MADGYSIKITIQAVDETTPTIRRLNNEIKKLESPQMKMRVDYDSPEFKKKTEAFKNSFQEVKKTVDDVKQKTKELDDTSVKSTENLTNMSVATASFWGNVVGNGLQMLADFILQSGTAMVNYSLSLNVVEKKFANIIGDTQKAIQHLKELRSFAIQQGADETWVISTAKDLERLKVQGTDVLGIIKAIGDSVSGTGGDQQDLQTISSAIENVIKTKRASLETILSLRDSGIDETLIWRQLQKETGKSKEELFNLAKQGKLTSDVFVKAYQDMAKVNFSGKMKEESETLAGSLKTIADSYWYFLSKGFGKGVDMINQGDWIQRQAKWIKERVSKDSPTSTSTTNASNNVPRRIDYSGTPYGRPLTAEEYAQQLEAQKQKVQNYYSETFDIISQNLKKQEAELGSHLRLSAQDEINYLVNQKNLRDYYLNEEIKKQTEFYNKQIQLNKGDANEVAKLNREKNEKIRGLNTELYLNETNTQKAIREAQRRILEQQRQDLISFKTLQVRESKQGVDSQSFNIERSIGLGGDIQSKFDELKKVTEDSYNSIVKSTKESYAIQLQNERLTIQQKINLNKEAYLTLAELAEQNRQKLQQIEDRKRDDYLQKMERSFARSLELENQFSSQIQIRTDDALLAIQTFGGDFSSYAENIKKEIKSLSELGVSGNSLQIKGLDGIGKLYASAKNKPFEKIELENLDSSFINQLEVFNKRREALNTQLEEYKKYGKETTDIEHQITVLGNEEYQARLKNTADYNQKYIQTLDGLKDKLGAIRKGQLDAEFNNEAEKNIVQEQISSYQEIANIKVQIANFDSTSVLEIEKASLTDILDLRNKELQAIISINHNQLEILQKGNYSQIQSDALVIEGLNSRIKSVNETLADFKLGIADGFLNPIDSFFDRINEKIEKMPSGIREITESFSNLFREITKQMMNKYLMRLFGFDSPQAITSTAQSSSSFNVGSLLGLFGNNSSSSYRTPSFTGGSIGSPSGASTIHELAQNITSTLAKDRTAALENTASGTRDRIVSGLPINDITRTAAGGKFSIGNLTSGLGGLAPLLGLSLGIGVGGPSTTGQILGGAGGLLGGLSAMGILAPTMFATLLGAGGLGLSAGVMAAIPIVGAIAAPLLLLGGWLIGRSKQRRQEEIQRTQVINDAFGQLDEILKQVNSDKMDGQSGIAQANSIRQQYLQQVSQLKDTKTRNIAIKDAARLDPKIDAIRQAASAQDTRKNIAEKWIPVYASGNYFGTDNQMSDMRSLIDMRRGYIAGNMPGVDRHFGMFADDEAIINRTHMNRINALAGYDLLAQVGIPNYPKSPKFNSPAIPKFAEGVTFSGLPPVSNSNSNEQDTIIQIDELTLVVDEEQLFIKGARSSKGGKVLFQILKSKIETKG